jgi:hypothetical protein
MDEYEARDDTAKSKVMRKVVIQMNEARLSQTPFNPFFAFKTAAEHHSSEQSQFINSCWGLIGRMLHIPSGTKGSVSAMHFSKVYQSFLLQSTDMNAVKFRSSLVNGAREWLESNFYHWVNKYIREQQSVIGGMPNIHKIVDEYLKIKLEGTFLLIIWSRRKKYCRRS